MTDTITVNSRTDESISAAAPLGPSAPLQIAVLQPVSTIELPPPHNQIALELKALRQQALNTQAGIEQLQLEQQNQPLANVLSGLPVSLAPGAAFLGVGMLILGGLLTWSAMHRLRSSSRRGNQELIDSYRPPDDSQDSSTWKTRESAQVVVAAPPEAVPTLPPESEFPPDAILPEAACDLDVNLEDFLPIKAPEIQAVGSSPEKPFAKTSHAPEFDPQAAAGEVERVLKSLTSKRAARSRPPQKTDSAILARHDLAMMILQPFDQTADRRRAADQDPTDHEAALSPVQQSPAPEGAKIVQQKPPVDAFLPNFGAQDQPVQQVADLQAVLPVEPTAALCQANDDEPDHEVQLSLAREFEALGLTHGARELAAEVLTSPDTTLSSYALALLRQIEDQELADIETQHSNF